MRRRKSEELGKIWKSSKPVKSSMALAPSAAEGGSRRFKNDRGGPGVACRGGHFQVTTPRSHQKARGFMGMVTPGPAPSVGRPRNLREAEIQSKGWPRSRESQWRAGTHPAEVRGAFNLGVPAAAFRSRRLLPPPGEGRRHRWVSRGGFRDPGAF